LDYHISNHITDFIAMTDISAAANISNAPSLADLSQRDKPWDKHRSNADKGQALQWASW
jgi:hypothetical protein